jgi:hypothetical protein
MAGYKKVIDLVASYPKNLDYFETALIYIDHVHKVTMTDQRLLAGNVSDGKNIGNTMVELADDEKVQIFQKLATHYFNDEGNVLLQYHSRHNL